MNPAAPDAPGRQVKHRSGWLGSTHVQLDICDSTNDEAAKLARAGAVHGAIVTARAQRAGRGRRGRAWFSPEDDNLYLSCILKPTCEPAYTPPLTLAAGLGVVDAIDACFPLENGGSAVHSQPRVTLKWPNDVLIDGRKVCGVLTEMSTRGAQLEHVIVGIGVNLYTRAFPPELCEIATSLDIAGASVERRSFIQDLCGHLEVWFDRFFERGARALVPAWMARTDTAGKRARARASRGLIEGVISGLSDDGRLQITDANGHTHIVTAGVIEYLD